MQDSQVTKSKYFVITRDLITPAVIIISVLVGLVAAYSTDLFSLQEINCTMDNDICQNQGVISELDKYQGSNLLTLDTASIHQKLVEGDFTIQKVTITKLYPRSLQVTLTSISPTAALTVDGLEGEWVTLDSNYRVIAKVQGHPQVPIVTVPQSLELRVGQLISDQEIITALNLSLAISQNIPGLISTFSEGGTVVAKFEDGVQVLFSSDKDYQAQIQTLQAILGGNTMTDEVRTIDVRFDRPVLK